MSSRFGHQISNDETDLRFPCESITQQPGSFYNGNFSSSIWGNSPVTPVWKATPPLSSGSYHNAHGHSSGIPIIDDESKMEPIISTGTHLSNSQFGTEMFSSGLQARKQDFTSSAFTFGFPTPPSAPSFSDACMKNVQNSPSILQRNFSGKQDGTSEGRTDIGIRISSSKRNVVRFPAQKTPSDLSSGSSGLSGHVDGLLAHSLAGYEALASNSHQQPMKQVYASSVSFVKTNGNSVQDRCFDHLSCAGPDLLQAQFASDTNDDVGGFVFGSSLASDSGPAFSKQKGIYSSGTGFRGTLLSTSLKGRKNCNGKKQRSVLASTNKACRSGPAKCNTDNPFPGNFPLNFTVDLCHESSSEYQKPISQKDSSKLGADRDPGLYKNFSSFQPGATSIGQDRGLKTDLDGRESEGCAAQCAAQAFDNVGHPLTSRQGNLPKERLFMGVVSDKGMLSANSFDKQPEKRETSTKVVSGERLHKVSTDTKEIIEGPKLTEFDLNSPGKLSAEDVREKGAKGGKVVEEMKRQKENLEPKLSFGDQKWPRPFVFGSSRTTWVSKHTVSLTDNDECALRWTNDQTTFETLVSKLGEKMESLGKFQSNPSDQENVEGQDANGISVSRPGVNQDAKGKEMHLPKGPASMLQNSDALDHCIDVVQETLTKGGNLDRQAKAVEDKVFTVKENTNDAALQHAVKQLNEQISKLDLLDGKMQKPVATSSASEGEHRSFNIDNSMLCAVKELSKQIAQLNMAIERKTENDQSSRLQEREFFEQSVDELRKRIETLGKATEEERLQSKGEDGKNGAKGVFVFNSCSTSNQKNSDSACIHHPKVSVNKKRYKAGFKPFANVADTKNFPSNGAHSSSAFPVTNPIITGQPSTINPFTLGQKPMANPFAPRQPTMSSSFTAGRQPFNGPEGFPGNHVQFSSPFSTMNPFAAGQSSKCNMFVARPLIANPFAAREPSIANPFISKVGRQPSSIAGHDGESTVFSFGSQSAGTSDNPGFSTGVFEFHGVKGPLEGSNVPRKAHKKASQSNSSISSHSTSSCQSAGSPMDFSPQNIKGSPSSKTSVSNDLLQESVQFFRASNSEIPVSVKMEEIGLGVSNLTIVNASEKASVLFECPSDVVNPFILRQKKGTWKRASRRGSGRFVSSESLGTELQNGHQMVHAASCGTDRGTSSTLSPLADPKNIDSRKHAQVNVTLAQNINFGFYINKFENSPEKIVNENHSLPFKPGKMDEDKGAFEIAQKSSVATSSATKQMCEKWRLRGNQAYVKGDYEKAEDCYTRGASCISPDDTSEGCLRASMLCYSNRAATRMAVGRIKEALADCEQAMVLDSSFLRVRLRAASCHLALGESKLALVLFADCLRLAKDDTCFDSKLVEEAKDGVRKSQSFDKLLEKASTFFQRQSHTDASVALQLLNEALTISPLSEATQDLKAQALFYLQRYDEVVQLCHKTLSAAEENHGANRHIDSNAKPSLFLNLWRWQMAGKALFQLGRLDESLSLLTKYEEAAYGLASADKATNIESTTQTISLIRDLLRHKAAGNEAFQDGRHTEALEHYTAALCCNSESRPYNAVCYCNRAAAFQALGHIADAIADCSRAIVLDSSYTKAISRRATLHEVIRDFGQSYNDLTRFIDLLESQQSILRSPKTGRTSSKATQDLKQARERIEKIRMQMKKECMVDYYLVLDLDVYCSPIDIKKAYRKAALKHHPDKAGQFLVGGKQGDGRLWKEVGDEFRKDAERLFKIIGEAYTILSDPSKRAQFDYENGKWKASGTTGYSNTTDSSPSEKTGRWRHEHTRGRSPRHQRWQNGPDAAQPDTHSEGGSYHWSKSKDRRQRGRKSDYQWEGV